MARTDPTALKAAGFKDDKRKGDDEKLRLELEVILGRSMKGPKAAIMEMVTGKGQSEQSEE